MIRTCIHLTFLHGKGYRPPYRLLDHLIEGELDRLDTPDPDGPPSAYYEVETFDESDPDDVFCVRRAASRDHAPDCDDGSPSVFGTVVHVDGEPEHVNEVRRGDGETIAYVHDPAFALAVRTLDAAGAEAQRRLAFLAGVQASARDLLGSSERAGYLDTGDVLDLLHHVVGGPAAQQGGRGR